MASITSLYPSRYLKADDVPDDEDLVLTISGVEVEEVGQGADAENKPVVGFRETDKTLVLNKTNATTIAGLYGDDTDDWIGKKVALFATEVPFGSKQVMGLRVRKRAPKTGKKPNFDDD